MRNLVLEVDTRLRRTLSGGRGDDSAMSAIIRSCERAIAPAFHAARAEYTSQTTGADYARHRA